MLYPASVTTIQIIALLQMAMTLLTMAQGSNVPESLRLQATTFANQAITAATEELALKSNEAAASANTGLQIKDVQSRFGSDGKSITITWETTLPARSRLSIEKVYESGVGTYHEVVIPNLSGSKQYNYHITAKTLDETALEDDVYGSFETSREYQVFIGAYEPAKSLFSTACRTVTVMDLEGAVTSGFGLQIGNVYGTTDDKGQMKYCYEEIGTVEGKNIVKVTLGAVPKPIYRSPWPSSSKPDDGSCAPVNGTNTYRCTVSSQ